LTLCDLFLIFLSLLFDFQKRDTPLAKGRAPEPDGYERWRKQQKIGLAFDFALDNSVVFGGKGAV